MFSALEAKSEPDDQSPILTHTPILQEETQTAKQWLHWAMPKKKNNNNFLSCNSGMCFFSTETEPPPLGKRCPPEPRCITNEFNSSESFFTIPRPVSECHFLMSSEALVSSGHRRPVGGQLPRSRLAPPAVGPSPAMPGGGALSWALSMLAKFSSLGNHQEFQCNEAFLSRKRRGCYAGLSGFGAVGIPSLCYQVTAVSLDPRVCSQVS